MPQEHDSAVEQRLLDAGLPALYAVPCPFCEAAVEEPCVESSPWCGEREYRYLVRVQGAYPPVITGLRQSRSEMR